METNLIKPSDEVLAISKFTFTRLGLTVGSERPSLAEYQQAYSKLKMMQDCVQFWIGDLYNAVGREFGEEALQIFDEFDYERRSITNFARICEKIPLARRRAELEFGHHEAVAALPPKDQDRLLNEAIEERETVQQLRRRVKEFTGKAVRPSLGQELMRLVNEWRDNEQKTALDCASELEQVIGEYGLSKQTVP